MMSESDMWIQEAEDDLAREDAPVNFMEDPWDWPEGRLRKDAPLHARAGQEVARRLRQAITQGNWSQRALAEKASVGQATISRILQGEVLPDIGTLVRLEAALQTSLYPADLYTTAPAVQ
jgi:ribosome-binding protein aMBF1 (putative translation factor)